MSFVNRNDKYPFTVYHTILENETKDFYSLEAVNMSELLHCIYLQLFIQTISVCSITLCLCVCVCVCVCMYT
jgi:hypothetical protein